MIACASLRLCLSFNLIDRAGPPDYYRATVLHCHMHDLHSCSEAQQQSFSMASLSSIDSVASCLPCSMLIFHNLASLSVQLSQFSGMQHSHLRSVHNLASPCGSGACPKCELLNLFMRTPEYSSALLYITYSGARMTNVPPQYIYILYESHTALPFM